MSTCILSRAPYSLSWVKITNITKAVTRLTRARAFSILSFGSPAAFARFSAWASAVFTAGSEDPATSSSCINTTNSSFEQHTSSSYDNILNENTNWLNIRRWKNEEECSTRPAFAYTVDFRKSFTPFFCLILDHCYAELNSHTMTARYRLCCSLCCDQIGRRSLLRTIFALCEPWQRSALDAFVGGQGARGTELVDHRRIWREPTTTTASTTKLFLCSCILPLLSYKQSSILIHIRYIYIYPKEFVIKSSWRKKGGSLQNNTREKNKTREERNRMRHVLVTTTSILFLLHYDLDNLWSSSRTPCSDERTPASAARTADARSKWKKGVSCETSEPGSSPREAWNDEDPLDFTVRCLNADSGSSRADFG